MTRHHQSWRFNAVSGSWEVPSYSLHPTFNSRLRRLLPAGELKR
jgi:hypothetical protein